MARLDRAGWRARFAGFAVGVAAAGSSLAGSGCRVAEDDVHRWESTAHGPEKLRAVLIYDKYDTALRVEAAMSLIRMKPRAGRRVGIGLLVDSLTSISPETRQVLIASLVPGIITELKKPPPIPRPTRRRRRIRPSLTRTRPTRCSPRTRR